ncbi:anti-anti-sigma factor [Saccharopolyspora lacisalsi]|uniref:Anti-sigma factor antagonist n=1 Tax=Halosaccharopolyspora lacisalsi TaxID=1000566 RepID=A0A839E182_9PSEU|nr:STAS domain-containing protein [Halosaccharopolyspora lacisalsi]MBA8827554.1 anti-anti-sigma factor [Halosaccharopolyspora lacisalsi]
MNTFDSSSQLETAESAESASGPNVATAVEWHDRSAVLTVSGEIDMVTAPRFEEALLEALHKEPATLVVDLSGVDFFASAGLSSLVTAYQRTDEHTELRVVATNSATVRPLQVTALDNKIPVHATREEALAA